MWGKAILLLWVQLAGGWSQPYTIPLGFLVRDISGPCVEWIFLLPSTWKTMTSLRVCLGVITISVAGRSWIISRSSKRTICASESSELDKKVLPFYKWKEIFKWLLLGLLRLSLGLSNINFFKFSPLLSYKYSCLTQVAVQGRRLGMSLLNDA